MSQEYGTFVLFCQPLARAGISGYNRFQLSFAAAGLPRGGTCQAHKGLGVDSYFICGDFFFLEAPLIAEDRCSDFRGPARSG